MTTKFLGRFDQWKVVPEMTRKSDWFMPAGLTWQQKHGLSEAYFNGHMKPIHVEPAYNLVEMVGIYLTMLISVEKAFDLDLKIDYDPCNKTINGYPVDPEWISYTDPKGTKVTLHVSDTGHCLIYIGKVHSKNLQSFELENFADLLDSYSA